MKSINAILIYLSTFMGMFLLMSFIGLLWNDTYYSVISSHNWFALYTIFFGWWMAVLPTREYYLRNERYFEQFS